MTSLEQTPDDLSWSSRLRGWYVVGVLFVAYTWLSASSYKVTYYAQAMSNGRTRFANRAYSNDGPF